MKRTKKACKDKYGIDAAIFKKRNRKREYRRDTYENMYEGDKWKLLIKTLQKWHCKKITSVACSLNNEKWIFNIWDWYWDWKT